MAKLTKDDKEQMLIDAIVMSWRTTNGASSILVGHPLSFYNYDALFKMLQELDNDMIDQGGESFLYPEYGTTRDYVDKFEKGGNIEQDNFKYDIGGL
jgi:hypothetical protein